MIKDKTIAIVEDEINSFETEEETNLESASIL